MSTPSAASRQMQPQAYFISDAWVNPNSPPTFSKNGSSSRHQRGDSNSCTDSLAYSATSSAQSAQSSTNSPFSKLIMDDIDKESEGTNYNACGGGQREGNGNAAVQEYYYRRAQQQTQVETYYRRTQHRAQVKQMQPAQQKKKEQPQLSIPKQHVPLNSNANLNYSKDDSSGTMNSISPTNSRHSKSSSDGSLDTPTPSSPPYAKSGMIACHASSMKPPHAKIRRASGKRGGGREDKAVDDLSKASYAESWMCGFADAFNFDEYEFGV